MGVQMETKTMFHPRPHYLPQCVPGPFHFIRRGWEKEITHSRAEGFTTL